MLYSGVGCAGVVRLGVTIEKWDGGDFAGVLLCDCSTSVFLSLQFLVVFNH